MRLTPIVTVLAVAIASPVWAQNVDPLTAEVDDSAAQRFARLWHETDGNPTAPQLQSTYLLSRDRALEVFTPNRIVHAENLARNIAHAPAVYRDAVERCLPWIADTNAELRSVYLGLRGLLSNRPLPKIAVVVGANNSGGTATPGLQVIGLEVICRLSPTRDEFRAQMRQFFAHETVHTFQKELSQNARQDPMLAQALVEGVPDFVTSLVTAKVPNPVRDAWARDHEAWIWRQFQQDRAIVRAGTLENGNLSAEAEAALRRWFGNAGDPPSGWPSELGYWVGMRIADSYVAQAPDPHAAIDQLLDPVDPAAIVAASGYSGSLPDRKWP